MMILVKCKSIQGLYCLLKRTPSESALIDKAFVLRPTNAGQWLFLCGQQPSASSPVTLRFICTFFGENKDFLEHRTDGTDAFDTLYIGCEKIPQHDLYPIAIGGVR